LFAKAKRDVRREAMNNWLLLLLGIFVFSESAQSVQRLRRASESRFSNEKDAFLLHEFGVENLKKNTVLSKTKAKPR